MKFVYVFVVVFCAPDEMQARPPLAAAFLGEACEIAYPLATAHCPYCEGDFYCIIEKSKLKPLVDPHEFYDSRHDFNLDDLDEELEDINSPDDCCIK